MGAQQMRRPALCDGQGRATALSKDAHRSSGMLNVGRGRVGTTWRRDRCHATVLTVSTWRPLGTPFRGVCDASLR